MKKVILLLYLIAGLSVMLANIPKIMELIDRVLPSGYTPKDYRSDW